jgi:hypothetical protein
MIVYIENQKVSSENQLRKQEIIALRAINRYDDFVDLIQEFAIVAERVD